MNEEFNEGSVEAKNERGERKSSKGKKCRTRMLLLSLVFSLSLSLSLSLITKTQ